jgi:hypothetical protein
VRSAWRIWKPDGRQHEDAPALLLALLGRHRPDLAAKATRALFLETDERLPAAEKGAGLGVESGRLARIEVSDRRVDVDDLLDGLRSMSTEGKTEESATEVRAMHSAGGRRDG